MAGPFPRPRPVSCVLGAPGQLGRGALPWACIVIPDDGRSTLGGRHRRKWRGWPARRPWSALLPFPLGVQPAAVPPAPAVEAGHDLGKLLFLLNLLFLTFELLRRSMRVRAVELAPARLWPRLVSSLAVGQHDCRRGSREAGEPRRGAPPKAQADAVGGGAKGAKRPEGRRARRALWWFDLGVTYAQARRVLRVFICFKEF